jgi:paraquat-inducible protein B
MSGAGHTQPLAHARTRRSRRLPVIWLIPIIAIAIGGWLAWDTLSKQGPTITITFETAEGLQAGQSQLKFRDIVLGTVKSLELSPDQSHVIVTVATTRQAEPLLTNKTVFWVVKPRLFAGSISGLDTLLSGSYIGMLPSTAAGSPQRAFTGHEDPPILQASVPGHAFTLKATRLGSISLGSPVFFRDLNVGEVLGWEVGDMARDVTIHAFVRAPYDRYVNDNTRFWNASGVSLQIGGAGIELKMESLRALLLGGIAFNTPDEKGAAPMSAENHVFPLFQDQASAEAASYSRKVAIVTDFPGSVRGLGAGSEVTMHGLVVGHVTSVSLSYDPIQDTVVAPVRYYIEPERIVGVGNSVYPTMHAAAAAALGRGLRASLQSANLLTGQQMIALEFDHNAPPAKVTMRGSDFVLPAAAGGGLAGLQNSATELLDKVNAIPFKQIGDNLNGLLGAANTAANGPQFHQALADLSATLGSARAFVGQLDSGASPAMKQLPEVTATLEKTLTTVNRLMLSLNSGYGDNTQFNRDVERLLVQLNDAVSSIRALADMLARHPDALLKGRAGGGTE